MSADLDYGLLFRVSGFLARGIPLHCAVIDRDDLYQEAALYLLRGRRGLASGPMLDLMRRVSHYRPTHARAKIVNVPLYEVEESPACSYEQDFDYVVMSRVQHAIDALPLRSRGLIYHKYVLGYVDSELSAVLGVSQSRIAQIHQKSLAEIRRVLETP